MGKRITEDRKMPQLWIVDLINYSDEIACSFSGIAANTSADAEDIALSMIKSRTEWRVTGVDRA